MYNDNTVLFYVFYCVVLRISLLIDELFLVKLAKKIVCKHFFLVLMTPWLVTEKL